MASVLDYVDVQISREIQTVSRVGFGSLLFLGSTDDGSGGPKAGAKIVSYGSLDEVSNDFDVSDPEYVAAQAYFGQEIRPDKLYIGFYDDANTYTDELDAIQDLDDDWYALAVDTRADADIEEIAAWTQAQYKIYLAASDASGIIDPLDDTDIASTLLSNNYGRTSLFYHSQAAIEYPEVAWAGLILPEDPGSVTWAWKRLAGIPTDTLNSAARAAAEDKRATYYVAVGGNSITFEGQTSEPGTFIDIIRGVDWLTFRISEDIVARLAAVGKIPYVGGGAILESIIRSRLDDAVDRDLIAEGYSVTVPPASEQNVTDRADRIYRDITFDAQLAGAVHRVEVRGTVTV
jgi:hypothetical protein